MLVKDEIKRMHIKNILHVPKLQENLLSVNKFLSNRLELKFNLNKRLIKAPNDEVVAITLCECKLYQMNSIKMYTKDAGNL